MAKKAKANTRKCLCRQSIAGLPSPGEGHPDGFVFVPGETYVVDVRLAGKLVPAGILELVKGQPKLPKAKEPEPDTGGDESVFSKEEQAAVEKAAVEAKAEAAEAAALAAELEPRETAG